MSRDENSADRPRASLEDQEPALPANEKPRNKGGRPPFKPNDEQRSTVRVLAMAGLYRQQIASFLDIDVDTLNKHFQNELRNANAFLIAKSMSVIFNGLSANKEETRISTAQFVLDRKGRDYGWGPKIAPSALAAMFEGLDLSELSTEEFKMFEIILIKIGVGRPTALM
jgi:hypothetical protein